MFWNKFILPISLLSGTIIGAGIFSLPYVFNTTGFLLSSIYAVIFCGIAITIYFIYSDLLRRNPGKRYVGLMNTYFGRQGYFLSFFIDIAQLLLVLTIYIVLSVSFLSLVIPGFSEEFYVICFWILSSVMIFVRIKKEAIGEFMATIGICMVVGIVVVLGFKNFLSSGNFTSTFSFSYALLPFGSLLFSFNGRSVIPELIAQTDRSEKRLKKIIFFGTVIPLFVYIFFVIGAIGISSYVVPDAVSGFIGHISSGLLFGIGILGLLALWSSYIAIGVDLRKTFSGDIKAGKLVSNAIVVLAPILLFMVGMKSFLAIIAITGGILTAIEWVFIMFMWKKSYKKSFQDGKLLLPKFSNPIFLGIICVLCIGIAYTISLFFM